MPHGIFTGSFAALEPRFIYEIRRIQNGDPIRPISILIGSNILASYLRYRIVEDGKPAANLRFFTFIDLARHVAGASGGVHGRPRLPRLGASLVLDRVLQVETPGPFENVADFAGFRDAILDTFRDLRDAGIGAEEFASAARKLGRNHPTRQSDVAALSDLYGRFRTEVRKFHDVDDDFRTAIRNLDRSTPLLPGEHLLVYGIYDTTGQQSDLLEALRRSHSIVCFIPFMDRTSTGFALPFLEFCRQRLGLEEIPLSAPGGTPLCGRVFAESAPGTPLPSDGSYRFVSAPGDSRAAVEVIREVYSAIRDGTIAGFHEAAVLVRHPEEDTAILAEAFRLRGVPHFAHDGMSFDERPLPRAVLAIAALESDLYARLPVFRAMELIASSLPSDKAQAWEVPNWRAMTRELPFLQGADRWDAAVGALVRERRRRHAFSPGESSLPQMEPEDARESPEQALASLESAARLEEKWTALRDAARDWPEAHSWEGWADLLSHRLGPLLSDSEDWQAFEAILDDLRSLEIIPATTGQPDSVARIPMLDALGELLRGTKLPQGRFLRSGVNILSLTAARGLRFPLVIIPGLDEGRFPARLREDPLLFDAERKMVGAPGRLPLKSERFDEEKLLFDMALRCAERRIVLLTSRLDEGSDRERLPSDFFLRAVAAARGGRVGLRDLTEENVPGLRSVGLQIPAPSEDEVAVDESEVRLRMISRDPRPAQALRELARVEPALLARPIEFDDARWQRRLTPYDGRIADPELAQWVARRFGALAGQVSAGRIEEYSSCPYRFYLKRVMGLQAWEEVDDSERLDPMERGKVVHEILENFLSQLLPGALEGDQTPELSVRLRELARSTLERRRTPGIPDLLWELERDALLDLLESWLRFEKGRAGEGLYPKFFEEAFGGLDPGKPAIGLPIQAGKHAFEIRGRIDRVDLSGDATKARVIDYKTGSLPKSLEKKDSTPLMAGERVQLVVYRSALSLLPDCANAKDIRGEYLHLQPKDGQVLSREFTGDEMRDAMARFPEMLEIIGDGIEGGVFFPRSYGSLRPDGHCKYCDFLKVCGKDRARVEERKSGAPEVTAFGKLKEIDGIQEEDE